MGLHRTLDITADQSHWGGKRFLEALCDRSINTQAEKMALTGNLSDAQLIKKGTAQFDAMCSGCHTGQGEQPTDLNEA